MRLVEPQRHMLLQIKSVVTWEQKGHKMIPDGKRPDGAAQEKEKTDSGRPGKESVRERRQSLETTDHAIITVTQKG